MEEQSERSQDVKALERKKNLKHMIHTSTPCYLLAQMVKNLPAMQETQVQSVGREDPLKKGMATHSNILDWRIPWSEEPGRLQSMKSQRVRHD